MGGSFAPAEEREWTPPPSCLLRVAVARGGPSIPAKWKGGAYLPPLCLALGGPSCERVAAATHTSFSRIFCFCFFGFFFFMFIKENMNGNLVNQIMMHGINHAQLCTCILNCILFKLNSKLKLSAAIHH